MSRPDFGPVYINSGLHKGRIGYFDDTDEDKAVILFGNIFLASDYYLLPYKYLSEINSNLLFQRRDTLIRVIFLKEENGKKISQQKRISYLEEIEYINTLLYERMYDAMFQHPKDDIKLFLSHSSKDKAYVTSLAVDLKSFGYDVWLDEWEIVGGESIPTKIGEGLKKCDFLILVLSPNSTSSRWVENEWQAKYWEEIELGKIKLIPTLIEKCEIPILLKMKKYIDLSYDYSLGLANLRLSIDKLKNG